jgi:hypothetical protein
MCCNVLKSSLERFDDLTVRRVLPLFETTLTLTLLMMMMLSSYPYQQQNPMPADCDHCVSYSQKAAAAMAANQNTQWKCHADTRP